MHTKSFFARHGIAEIVLSDNGPQYASEAFAKFAQSTSLSVLLAALTILNLTVKHARAVQNVKRLLKKEGDPYFKHCYCIKLHHCIVDIVLQNY